MLAQVSYVEYYNNFKLNVRAERVALHKRSQELEVIIDEKHDILKSNIEKYKKLFNLDLNNYIEFTEERLDNTDRLINFCNNLSMKEEYIPVKKYFNYIKKYVNDIEELKECRRRILILTKALSLNNRDYVRVLKKYYDKVSEIVLNGQGYKYRGGVGILSVEKKKFPKDHRLIDMAKSAQLKKEITEAGLKPYKKSEAELYAAKGMPYDGIEYLVPLTKAFYYRFVFRNAHGHIIFYEKHTTLSNGDGKTKFRTYSAIAKNTKTEQEFYKLPFSFKIKLLSLLAKYPQKGNLFKFYDGTVNE